MVCKGWQLATGCAVLAVTIVASTAWAYILPAEAILSSMATRRARIAFKSLVMEGTSRQGDGPERDVWEAVLPGKAHRLERKSPTATEVDLTVGKKRWRFMLGEAAKPATVARGDLWMTFLGNPDKDPGGRRGLEFLEYHGIDNERVSLSRLEKQIVYVIGAGPGELDKPQLWVDKQFLLPTRLITRKIKEGVLTDIRLFDYGSAATGEWCPRKYELWENGSLVETITYQSAELNEGVAAELFAPPN